MGSIQAGEQKDGAYQQGMLPRGVLYVFHFQMTLLIVYISLTNFSIIAVDIVFILIVQMTYNSIYHY